MARKFIHILLVTVVKLLLKVTVSGAENVPPSGPLIIMMNHIAFLDPVVVTACFPRWVVSMAKAEAFSLPVWGPLIKIYGAFPIERGAGDVGAIRQAIRVLQQGNVLLMAPEGTRSRSYSLQPAQEGLVTVATRSGAPVIPVAITGAHQAKRNWLRLRRAPIQIAIGQPFAFKESARRQRRAAIDEAMARLAAILPEPFRGVYSDLSGATSTHLAALEAPAEQRQPQAQRHPADPGPPPE
ncbi:MAG: lysophospholipid acyltransferase family protein [Anaerolineae bacterium]